MHSHISARKLALLAMVTLLAAAMLVLMSGVAFAGFGPHGSFDKDTDACAGCHRAHTSISLIKWEDGDNDMESALLVGSDANDSVKSFCYTCHGPAAAGAATDVSAGMLDAAAGNSEVGAPLNGGGFEEFAGDAISSSHDMPTAANPQAKPAFGGLPLTGTGGVLISMDCSSCHDPHGSSNYRLLKDNVNNVQVGGYDTADFAGATDPDPTPWVISNEEGYPLGGFRLHQPVATTYKPDYTAARYARPVDDTTTAGADFDSDKGVSGWCASCHTEYNTQSSNGQAAYDAGDGLGNIDRHRHPVNVPLANFMGDRALITTTTATGMNAAWGDGLDLPLEHDAINEDKGVAQDNDTTDFIGCLTCHRAHGTNATMDGYAAGKDPNGTLIDNVEWTFAPSMPGSAILRADNRGVCERCHNK